MRDTAPVSLKLHGRHSLASILGREGAGKLSVRVFEAGDRGRDQGAGWDVDEVGQRALLRGGVHPSSYQRMYSDTFKLAMATPVDDESVDDGALAQESARTARTSRGMDRLSLAWLRGDS